MVLQGLVNKSFLLHPSSLPHWQEWRRGSTPKGWDGNLGVNSSTFQTLTNTLLSGPMCIQRYLKLIPEYCLLVAENQLASHKHPPQILRRQGKLKHKLHMHLFFSFQNVLSKILTHCYILSLSLHLHRFMPFSFKPNSFTVILVGLAKEQI